jgi:hypothetical protein
VADVEGAGLQNSQAAAWGGWGRGDGEVPRLSIRGQVEGSKRGPRDPETARTFAQIAFMKFLFLCVCWSATIEIGRMPCIHCCREDHISIGIILSHESIEYLCTL